MIDTNTVKEVAQNAHGLIDIVSAAILAVIGIIGYLGGFFHGLSKVIKGTTGEKK